MPNWVVIFNLAVENFLEMACSTALFGGSSNKEYALHILHRTRGNVKVIFNPILMPFAAFPP